MYIKLDKIRVGYLKAAVIFLPVFFYTPFFFNQVVHPVLRIGGFAILSSYLFFSSKRYSTKDGYIFLLLILLFVLMLFRNSSGTQGLFTLGNYCLTLFFGWGLYRHLTLRRARSPILLGLYVRFFYVVAVCSMLSLLFLIFFGEVDLFGLKTEMRQHLVTPFGAHFGRKVGSFSVYRSFFYFVEGAHLGIFYAANIIIVAPLLGANAKPFKRINILGGFLTMSMTFYAVLIVLYGYRKAGSLYGFIFAVMGAVFLIYLGYIIDVVSYSSSDDRTERFLLFFLAMGDANIVQLLFGHGVSYETGFAKAFNSGLSLSIYETGFVGTVLQISILYILSPSFIIFILFLLAALVVDPIHMPIFLFLVVVVGHRVFVLRKALGQIKKINF